MATPGFQFQFEVTPAGPGRCRIEAEGREFACWPTHVPNDPLRELLSAAAMLAGGASEARAALSEEPGFFVWRFARIDGSEARVSIRYCRDRCEQQ